MSSSREPIRGYGALFLGLLLLLLAAAAIPVYRHFKGEDGGGILPIGAAPPDNPDLGLIYQGLTPAKKGAACVGGYEVTEPGTCSHGPDAPPPGLTVSRDVTPVAPATAAAVLPQSVGTATPRESDLAAVTGSAPAILEETAVDTPAAVTVGPNGVVCDGDGVTGRRVQVLYAYPTGTASRFAQYLASFRTWAAGVDTIYDASAAETGGSRHLRYVTTPDCQVDVDEVELPAGAIDTFNATITALRNLGYYRSDRKYMIFADSKVYCGIGTFAGDERAGATNRSNGGPSYGRSDSGCWTASVAAHELGHNLGAVNNSAPNSSKAGHCVDEYDVMCYNDSSGNPTRVVCTQRSHDQRLDCNHDDYYNTNPSPGSYLATHWNVADNQFLINGSSSPAPAPTPTATVTVTTGPTPTLTPTTRPPTSPTVGPTVTPTGPTPSPTSGALRISDMTSTSVRLTWDAAATGSRYAVRLNNQTLGTVRTTTVRIVGLRSDTAYSAQIMLAGTTTAVTPATSFHTPAVAFPPIGAWATFGNALTGGAPAVYGARTAAGTPLVLRQRTGGASQQWQLKSIGEGAYQLVSKVSGACAAPAGGLTAGAPLVQKACATGDASQLWRILLTPYGFSLQSTSTSLVIGVSTSRYSGSRLLVLQRPTGARYQSWTAD